MSAAERELIPVGVRRAVRNAVGGWGIYAVAEIQDLFEDEGFAATQGAYERTGTQRRDAAERYHAAIDWRSYTDVSRYLRVVERILKDHDTEDADARQRRERLLAALHRAGITLDEQGRLHLPAAVATQVRLADLTNESDIRFHLNRLARLDQEPEEMIGAAKELVEATAKHVLLELGETFDARADVATLSRAALGRLGLHPEAIAPTAPGARTIQRMLGGLTQIATGLAELRNEGYGTGHGRGRRVTGLTRRHAEFAARAAVTYAIMLLDTLHDPDAPWQRPRE